MAQPTAQQLAELLIGIARAQAAVVNGLESEFAGIRSGRVMPSLQNAAHLRDHPDPTLVDLPVRVLLASFGRTGPDAAAIARDLERLFSGASATPPPAAAAPASAESTPAPDATNGLDFSKPG
ncbi:MAG TPA: hypothetical protein VHN19_17425 [Burkholderiales bacterium]|jgi:hypothetical protein|nr:hypothetical protein [Burkholderiales bacterium]